MTHVFRSDATGVAPPQPRPRTVAVLAARDRESLKWGARWLQSAGLEVVVAGDLAAAAAAIERHLPGVILVEPALRPPGTGGSWPPNNAAAAVMVLAPTAAAVEQALADGATDIVPLPCDWRLVARRAAALARAVESHRELAALQRELAVARAASEQAHRELATLVGSDPLTALPNRQRFESVLARSLRALRPADGKVALLLVDLDRFKSLNEVAGRQGGSEVLRQLGSRLQRALEDGSVAVPSPPGVTTAALARMSGDEFTVLLSGLCDRQQALHCAERLLQLVREPFTVGGRELLLSASIGIAVAPEDGLDAEALLQRAELAVGWAKHRGGGAARFYAPDLERPLAAATMEQELRGALERDELCLAFQPLVEVSGGRIVGSEALLRWQHPRLGVVPPDDFIPVAEEAGLMPTIGEWVFSAACQQLRRWLDRGLPPLRLAINVAVSQLLRGDFPEVVAAALARYQLDSTLLELEISERGILQEEAEIGATLARLKQLGVRLSVDDFGTGHTALDYLRRFPIDVLKIDRSYVAAVERDGSDTIMASAMVAMAQRLGMSVVAEGVEEEGQLRRLREWGCDTFQGFLFSPPLAPEELGGMLLAQETR
jgi:diguanylate cyclase (GGDEF)-like protein